MKEVCWNMNPEESAIKHPIEKKEKKVSRRAFCKLGLLGASAMLLGVPSYMKKAETAVKSKNVEKKKKKIENSEIIDHVETFGHREGLTQRQLDSLITDLNSVQREMKEDTHYVTLFISEENYKQFPDDNDKESFNAFIKRHDESWTAMLNDAQPRIRGGLKTRRIIVVKNKVQTPASHHYGYLENGIQDSDGTWNVSRGNTIYKPKEAGYYDRNLRLDRGLLHEIGHSTFDLPDIYSIDFDYRGSEPLDAFRDVPKNWQSYTTSRHRTDSPDTIMNCCSLFSNYESKMLHRRKRSGHCHNKKKNLPEQSWSFPREIPQTTIFNFGKTFKDSTIELYRSCAKDKKDLFNMSHEKTLEMLPLENRKINSEGEINIGNPFRTATNLKKSFLSGQILCQESVLFIKVIKPNNEIAFRWLDVRDFNLPVWERNMDETVVVMMKMKLAATQDTQEEFDAKVNYY